MRSLRPAVAALVLGLVACGHPAAGPAWPKSAGTVAVTDPAEDGGESLEPRGPAEAAAALEEAPDRTLTELLDEPAAPSAAAPVDTPPTTDPPVVPVGTVETIEIEIQDITLEPDLVTP
jgi:hypothetical protein